MSESRTERVIRGLFLPVDGSSLAVFRICFGLTMLWEVYRFFSQSLISKYYLRPELLLKYDFFEWVTPWPGDGLLIHFNVLGLCAALIALGLLYRWAAALFCVGFIYVFLLAATRYLNHMYLVCLLSVLMVFVPADSVWSIRSWRSKGATPSVRAWHLWLLRAQVGLVYFYGGVAKLNGDWLSGVPLRSWLYWRRDYPLLGDWFTQESAVYFFSYTGILLDLFIVPALLWRRTRVPALAAAFVFHVTNGWIFGIGIFPWLMLFATTLFFDPDWPRQVIAAVRGDRPLTRALRLAVVAGASVLPALAAEARVVLPCLASALTALLIVYGGGGASAKAPGTRSAPNVPPRRQALALGFAGVWVAFQILVPLRHHVIPGDVAWTEEGHRFAWRMKLRQKHGQAIFFVERPGAARPIKVYPSSDLTKAQYWKAVTQPHFILQYANLLADRYTGPDGERPVVRARAWVSLNDRPYRAIVDESVDLASFRPTLLAHQSWITENHDPPPQGRELPELPSLEDPTPARASR